MAEIAAPAVAPVVAGDPGAGPPTRLEPDDGVGNPVTFAVLGRQVETVRGQCREITGTLSTVDDALQMLSSGAPSSDWAGFGLVSLPIVASLRAAKGLMGQYVKQQTGVGLAEWTSLVATAGDRFEAYLARLDTVSRLAEERRQQPAPPRPDEARGDLHLLAEVGWETAAWKLLLGRVAQLGHVVDAILQAEIPADPVEGEPAPEPAPGSAAAAFGGLRNRLKDVQHRTIDRSGDLKHWVLHPFLDVRDRARALPGQVETLSRSVGQLELLVELVEAELRVVLGLLSPDDQRLVRQRVAAAVLLPELARSLEQVRAEREQVTGYLARLEEGARSGTVTPAAHARVAPEYQARLEDLRVRQDALGEDVAAWRRDGDRVLAECLAWVGLQLEVLAAREAVGEPAPTGRRTLLERERDRLGDSRQLLASL